MKSINMLRADRPAQAVPLFEKVEPGWFGLAWLATMAALAGALMNLS